MYASSDSSPMLKTRDIFISHSLSIGRTDGHVAGVREKKSLNSSEMTESQKERKKERQTERQAEQAA